MSVRVVTTLCELGHTLDQLTAYQNDEVQCPGKLHPVVTTIATALDQSGASPTRSPTRSPSSTASRGAPRTQ